MIRANRMALILHLGRELEDWEEAYHTCDNPTCCNPNHLFVGSHTDNMNDYGNKHFAKGERHSRVKVTQEDYRWARSMWESGKMTQKQIASALGVHKAHVSRLVRGLTGHEVLEKLNEG